MAPDHDAPTLTRDQLSAIDLLREEFAQAFRSGQSPEIASYLTRATATGAPAAVFAELLRLELALRRQRGDQPQPHEYLAQYPAFEDEIRDAFAPLDARHNAHLDATLATRADGDPSADTVAHLPAHSHGALHMRCPHCHASVPIAPEAQLECITCSSCGADFSLLGGDDPPHPAPLAELAHFKLLDRLGMGAFGTVWKARDTKLDRTVAIKIPRAGQLDKQRQEFFFREARSAAQLRHPHIVPVYEVGREGDTLYIVSEFVQGVTLADALARGPMPPREVARLAATIAGALHHAHERGVVHRDLKPANVMIDHAGQPHLMDFGLARRDVGEITLTLDGQLLGTPAYMSPEQARGEAHLADRQSDVYSLGVMMFEMLAGQLPFTGSPASLVHQVIHNEPPSLKKLRPDVPRDLETICATCLAKEKPRRYPSAFALEQDLTRFLADEPIAARPTSRVSKLLRKAKRNPVASLAAALAVVGALVGAGFWAQSRRTAGDLALASKSAESARLALDRVQDAKDIRQLAVLPFRNLSAAADDDWLSAGFASTLETRLSDIPQLKIVGAASIEDAEAEAGLDVGKPLEDDAARRLGQQLVINHVLVGEFQRLGGEIQVSARIVNVNTGAIDRGGMRVAGRFPDQVFALQAELAAQCLARLGVAALAAVAQDAPAAADQPAANVEAWMLLGKGQHALENRDFDEAVRLLNEAIQLDPQLAKAYRTLGQAYAQSERTEDAVAAFKKALALDPNDLVSLTYYNLLSGRTAEGVDAMDRAAKAGVADLDVLKLSAPLRLAAGIETGGDATGKLIADLEQALKKHATDDELWILLGFCYANAGQKKLAFEALEKAVEVRPASYRARLLLAVEYDEVGRKDDAQKQLAEAQRLRPQGAAGFRAFGRIYLDTGEPDRALAEYQRSLELEPDNRAAHAALGQIYAGKRDFPAAITHLETALRSDPESPFLLSSLCRLANLVQDNSRLTKYASQWAQADPESYEAHQYLRIAYLKTGETKRADHEAQRLAGLTPTHASFFVLTGNALIQASGAAPALLDEAFAVLAKGHAEFSDNKLLYSLFKLSEGMKALRDRQWHRAILALKKSAAAAPRIRNVQLDCYAQLAVSYMALGDANNAAEAMHRVVGDLPTLTPLAMNIYARAERPDYALPLVEKQLSLTPGDQRLQEAVVNLQAALGRWDQLRAFVDNLPATTDDECRRRLHLGGMFADRMELFHRFDPAEKQQYLEALVASTRQRAAASDRVNADYLAALERWAFSEQPWLVAVPFPGQGGLDAPLAPEKSLDPDAVYDGHARAKIRWQLLAVRPGNTVDLKRLYDGADQVAAYAVTYIHSPQPQSLKLRFDGRDFVKAWFRDKVIVNQRLGGPSKVVDVELQAGPNRLLLKTVDRPLADWPFEVTALDARGWPAAVAWSSDPDPDLGAARAAAHKARDLVGLRDEAVKLLQNDQALSDPQRARALQFAASFDDDPAKLNRWSWRVAKRDGLDDRLYRLALRQAAAAVDAEPDNHAYLTTLGVAQYRVGDYEDATRTLAHAEQSRQKATGAASPVELAVAAMARRRLGQHDKSRRLYDRARDIFRGNAYKDDPAAHALLEEADRIVTESQSEGPNAATAADIEELKQAYADADHAGWLHHDLDAYLEFWSDDAQVTNGRGPAPTPQDKVMNKDAYRANLSLQFQQYPADGLKFVYDNLQVRLEEDDRATLDVRTVVQFPGGRQTWEGAHQLHRTKSGWRITRGHGRIVDQLAGDHLTVFNDDTYHRLDAAVDQARSENDLRKLVDALSAARRFREAHEVARQLTAESNAPVADWMLRGQLAIAAAEPQDAIEAYKKVMELDPNAPIPRFKEIAVPAPATFKLAGIDLPPDQEANLKSLNALVPAELTVKNETPYTLVVYWLNYEGRREGFNSIHPGGTWVSSTFVTHPFLVCDADSRPLGVVRPTAPARTVALTEAQPSPPPNDQ